MRKWYFLILCLALTPLVGEEIISKKPIQFDFSPYFYKVMTLSDWYATQEEQRVVVLGEDEKFIRLEKKNQIGKIISGYRQQEDIVVVLKIYQNKIAGELEFKSSPDKMTAYYYLRDGVIPFEAIAEATIVYLKHKEMIYEELDSSGS